MTLKLESTTNELGKGWKLAWCHYFTHIACVKRLSGLRQKLNALVVQSGQSLSKYEGFERKLIYYKGISFWITYFKSILFVCLICTIERHMLNYQPFMTSFDICHAFNDLFWAKWPWNWKAVQMNSEKVEAWHDIIISPT